MPPLLLVVVEEGGVMEILGWWVVGIIVCLFALRKISQYNSIKYESQDACYKRGRIDREE